MAGSEDEESPLQQESGSISVDIAELYKFEAEDLEVEVSTVGYSNEQFIQVSQRDLFIDFLELPGVKREGKMKIDAIRIYMNHKTAKKFAETLLESLQDTSAGPK